MTEQDLQRIIHEEFVHWFDATTAGPADRYDAVTREIWRIWLSRFDTPGEPR